MTKPTKLSEIDTTKLTFTELKAGGKGGKFGNVQYDGKKPLFKLPKVKTFGGDEYVSEDGRKDYTMTLQITKEMEESDKEIAAAIEGFQKSFFLILQYLILKY